MHGAAESQTICQHVGLFGLHACARKVKLLIPDNPDGA
ncbi:hypothetical protein B188_28330 [Candidatus Brocadiaceae bacterium B188]|nr:hypothetical protein B188_28330 [Candidatus Brocadiaceae bacterium B188]